MQGPSASVSIAQLTCKVCTKNSAKYTCPRCSINYCSLACYRDRRHGKCSERFYRECCEDAMKNLSVDDENFQQIQRMISQSDIYEGYDDVDCEMESADENSCSDESTDLSERYGFTRFPTILTLVLSFKYILLVVVFLYLLVQCFKLTNF